jgi:hypothetical protein
MVKAVRQPTSFLTQAQLYVIACEKTEQAEHMPIGAARNEMLSSANLFQRLGQLHGRFEAEKRRMN